LAFFKAHYESGYEEEKQTVYYTSTMPILIRRVRTYDVNLDPWTKEYLGKPEPAATLNQTPLFSKYNSGFTYVAPAPKTPKKPTVEFLKDSIAGDKDT
jgi:hypothetical protein